MNEKSKVYKKIGQVDKSSARLKTNIPVFYVVSFMNYIKKQNFFRCPNTSIKWIFISVQLRHVSHR